MPERAMVASLDRGQELPLPRGLTTVSPQVILVRAMSLFDLFRKRCPGCGKRKLHSRQFLKETRVDDEGRRFPASTEYVECSSCGARFKNDSFGPYEPVADDEWADKVPAAGSR